MMCPSSVVRNLVSHVWRHPRGGACPASSRTWRSLGELRPVNRMGRLPRHALGCVPGCPVLHGPGLRHNSATEDLPMDADAPTTGPPRRGPGDLCDGSGRITARSVGYALREHIPRYGIEGFHVARAATEQKTLLWTIGAIGNRYAHTPANGVFLYMFSLDTNSPLGVTCVRNLRVMQSTKKQAANPCGPRAQRKPAGDAGDGSGRSGTAFLLRVMRGTLVGPSTLLCVVNT